MSKQYPYPPIDVYVSDDQEVELTVEFISDGNSGPTYILTPDGKDHTIKDAGKCSLGKASKLREGQVISTSVIANPAPMEDEIRIKYKINGKEIKEHLNLKSETDQAIITLYINFPSK